MNNGQKYSLYLLMNAPFSGLRQYCESIAEASAQAAVNKMIAYITTTYSSGGHPLFMAADFNGLNLLQWAVAKGVPTKYSISPNHTQIGTALFAHYSAGNCPHPPAEAAIISALIGANPAAPPPPHARADADA